VKYLVEDFGARADARSDGTNPIQSAIDHCHEAGGGTVVLGSGTYISGTLELKSGVELSIGSQAVLRGIGDLGRYPELPAMLVRDGCSENPNPERKGYAFVYAYRAADVAISGGGTIDVGGERFQGERVRPFAVRFIECSGVRIEDMTLRQSAAWCCHLHRCNDVAVRGVRVRTEGIRNGDGIDIDSCADVTIEGCDVSTSDDAICLKTTSATPCHGVAITDCTLASNCSGVKIGSESVGDFSGIVVSRCTLRDCGVVALKVTAVDGGAVRDVTFSDLTIENSTGPVFVATGDRGRRYGDEDAPPRHSQISDLTFRKIVATTRRYERRDQGTVVNDQGQGIVVSGRPGQIIRRIRLSDIDVSFWGGVEDPGRVPHRTPVLDDEYPECHKLGVLPAYGYSIQYASDVVLENCSDHLLNPDARPLRWDGPSS
jgi:polygalacturonase